MLVTNRDEIRIAEIAKKILPTMDLMVRGMLVRSFRRSAVYMRQLRNMASKEASEALSPPLQEDGFQKGADPALAAYSVSGVRSGLNKAH